MEFYHDRKPGLTWPLLILIHSFILTHSSPLSLSSSYMVLFLSFFKFQMTFFPHGLYKTFHLPICHILYCRANLFFSTRFQLICHLLGPLYVKYMDCSPSALNYFLFQHPVSFRIIIIIHNHFIYFLKTHYNANFMRIVIVSIFSSLCLQ